MTIALHVDQKRDDTMLGASEAAAALGADPYKRPITIWRQHRGLPVDEAPAHVQEAAEWGHALEPVVRGKYALKMAALVAVPTVSIVRDGWLRATPDGFSTPVVAADEVGVIEGNWPSPARRSDWPPGLVQVKTCSPYAWNAWDEAPPPHHEIQCRVEMAVCDLPWNDLVYLIGGQRMVIHRIERKLDIEGALLDALKAFWSRVQLGVEPAPDDSDAYRKHISERMKATGKTMLADEGTSEMLREWREARAARKKLQGDEERVKTNLLLRMSAAAATSIDANGMRVAAYQCGGRTDWKGYALSLGGKASPPERFVKPSTTWALRAPKEWGDDEG